jgi:hypothetical protein
MVETKDIIALGLLLIATLTGVAVTSVSPRARDLAFFLMLAGAVVAHKLDINFLTHFWYRGTTRGLEVSFVDVLAMSVLVSSFLFPPPGAARRYWPASFGWMLLFFAYAALSVVFAEPKMNGVFELSKMVRGLVFFLAAAFFVRSERELSIVVLALGCAMCFEGALAVKQRALDGVYRVTGSLEHENSFSMYLCLVGPVFVAAATSTLPRSLRYLSIVAIGLAGISILLTISRAGIPIFAFVMLGTTLLCVTWRVTLKKMAATCLIFLCLAAVLARAWDTLKDRYLEATFEQEYLDENLEGRGFYLRLAKNIVADRFFGVGLNNWSHWVSKTYGPQLGTPYEDYDDLRSIPDREEVQDFNHAAPAHNLGALVIGELGVPGLFLFALLWLRWFQMGLCFVWPRVSLATSRLGVGILFGIGGVFLQSVTEWTFRQTHIYLTFHALLGVLAGLYHLRRRAKRIRIEESARPDDEETPATAGLQYARS